MRVLLVGSGAREHAMGWSLSRSNVLTELASLPGNPGLAGLGPVIEGVSPTDVGAVAALAQAHRFDLVVVGPEAPLAAGLVDAVHRTGIPVFGPTRSAARLEASKAFAKEIMQQAGVPTAAAGTFTDPADAKDHLARHHGPYVVKADGLAAGKGVLVTDSRSEAGAWVDRCFEGGFGQAGATVVIEEYLDGPELSVFAICDGAEFRTLEPARDYKRLLDGDAGPNTGGMGSYSPVDLASGLIERVEREVIVPSMAVMAERGHPYRGFLYAGLALTATGPKVIEFNCRLGDPETQVVLPRLETDFLALLHRACTDGLAGTELTWSPTSHVNVVLAAGGYPDSPRKGDTITGLDRTGPDVTVFHAGTAAEGRGLRTSGGRVLSVVGRGANLAAARERAYEAVHTISFTGKQFRSDIASG